MDPAASFVLAVDIGGTKVDAALFTHRGDVLRGSITRRPTGPAADRDALAHSIREAALGALATQPDAAVTGVGIGSAGPVDLPRTRISPLNLPAARELPVGDVVRAALHAAGRPEVPVALALDGTCIALAEHRFGALRGTRDAIALVVSTGVGGGVIAGGRPVTGRRGNAGHIGQLHVATRVDGDPLVSTLEAVAAGPGTVRWAREHGFEGTTGEELAAAHRAGSAIAEAAIARSATAVGEAIAMVATLLDIERASIAGGFALVADDYVERVARAARVAAVHEYSRDVEVVRSALGGDGPLTGAAALVLPAG